MQTLEQTQLKTEQLLQTIDYSLIQYINTSRISESVRKPVRVKDYPGINELREGLYKLQTYEKGIENVRLVSLEGRWVLDNSGYSSSFANLEMKTLSKFIRMSATSGWFTDLTSENVQLIKKIPVNSVREPAGLLEVTLPSHRLEQLVPARQNGAESLILDSEHHRLTSPKDQAFSKTAMEQIVPVLLADHLASGYERLNIDGQPYGMSYRLSDYNGWTYISLVSINEIAKESRAIGWYTFWICTGVFIGLAAFSLFASRRIYMPIRHAFEAAMGLEPGDRNRRIHWREFSRKDGLKGVAGEAATVEWPQDELRAIGERVQSLKFSESRLMKEIENHTVQLRGLFVRKLLTGEMNPRDIQSGMEQVHYAMNAKAYCVIAVQADTFSDTRFRESDRDLLLFAVSNMVADLVPACSRMDPVVIGEQQVTLLTTDETDEERRKLEVHRLAQSVQEAVKEVLGLGVSVGISRFLQDMAQATQAYKESVEALKYRIRFGENVVLHVEDVLPDQEVQMMFPEWIEKRLIDALHVPDLDLARECLHELLEVTLRESHSHQEYQMILFRLLSDLIREFQTTGEALLLPSGDVRDLFEQLVNLKTSADVERWFMKTILEPMVEMTTAKWGERNTNISQQMMEIIHANVEQDLTLDTCAAKLNYHPNYLKTVFRKETGVNFSDYVSRHRLNQAKQWLVETDMKIGDIAEQLGYRNAQNFIRYFRKVEEMTPGEYRKKYQK
ncbi:helix-turn-helix domain-containing protein [Paenibacillus taichungensis]|uniref:helix-turn-helix domain-containing protein n=1 Tax=Paenibacillus taichungensis TaxID=484184 RepID=UPI0039A6892D